MFYKSAVNLLKNNPFIQNSGNEVSTLVAHQIKQEGKDSSSNETLLEIFHHGELNAKVRRSDEDCNIFFKCRPDFFPVSLATGNILWQSPRMCINGFKWKPFFTPYVLQGKMHNSVLSFNLSFVIQNSFSYLYHSSWHHHSIPVRLMARGLNVAVFDPTSLKLKTFKNFDTFADGKLLLLLLFCCFSY